MGLSDIPKSFNFLLIIYSLAYVTGFEMDPVMFFYIISKSSKEVKKDSQIYSSVSPFFLYGETAT